MGDESNAADTPPNDGAENNREAVPLTITERSAMRRLSSALRFADFMALLMVAATGFSAFATWRTAQVTHQLFMVAERPYLGIQRASFEVIDSISARLVIDCRNFGTVSARDGVARFRVLVDGAPLPASANAGESTINVGNFTPTVPHPFHLFIPIKTYEEARAGRARIILHVQMTFRGPDQREFCYNETFTYDHRADSFDPSGGDVRCDSEIF